MPTIGRATIDVDYDGRDLPRQARRLGEDAGQESADGFGERFRRQYERDMNDRFRDQAQQWRRAGGDSGKKFGQAFNSNISRDLDNLTDRVSHVFSDTDGLENYRRQLFGAEHQTGLVTRTTDLLRAELRQLKDSGRLTGDEMDILSGRLTQLGRGLRGLETRDVNARTRDLAGATRELDREFLRLNPHLEANRSLFERLSALQRDGGTADQFRDLTRDARGLTDVLGDVDRTFLRLNPNVESNRAIFQRLTHLIREGGTADQFRILERDGRRLADTYDGDLTRAMSRVDRAFLNLNPHLSKNAELSGRLGTLARSGGTSDEFRRLAIDAERLAGNFGDLEPRIDGAGNAANRSHGKFAKLFGAFSRFDPGDNIGQLFLLLVALAGPLAAGISALAAQVVILGTVAAAALVGIGGLVVAFKGMFGDISKLPRAVQPAARALQGLKVPLQDLQDQLQVATFRGMADNFRALGTKALPALSSGVRAVGGALNTFLSDLSSRIVANRGAINDLLKGFAPIIANVGKAVTQLIGVFGGLFRAALPFAQSFAKNLTATIGKWSDWINSIAGQKALQNWFRDAQPILAALGSTLGKLGQTFADLVTPETSATLIGLLQNIGNIGPKLAGISVALSPAIGAVGDLLEILVNVVSFLNPVLAGIGRLAQGIIDFFRPAVDFLGRILAPVFQSTGIILDTLGRAFTAAAPVMKGLFDGVSAAIAPFLSLITQVQAKAGAFAQQIIAVAQPALNALGQAYRDMGAAIGAFLGPLIDAVGQTTLFQGAGGRMAAVINGPVKGAFANLTTIFQNVSAYIRNNVIPAIHEIDWTQVTQGLNIIISMGPNVVAVFRTIVSALGTSIGVFGSWASVATASANVVITAIRGAATVVDKLSRGDIAGALAAASKAAGDTGKATGAMGAAIGSAIRTSSAAYAKLGADGRTLQANIDALNVKGAAALAAFQRAGAGNLQALATRLGTTGSAATAFRGQVASAAQQAGVKLAAVANAQSLPDLLNKLKITGAAAQTQWAAKTVAAAAASGAAVDRLPPKLLALAAKYNALPASKQTKVSQTGAEEARAAIERLATSITNLHGKTINIAEVTTRYTKGGAGGTLGATGGILAGGELYKRGAQTWRRFARGGITGGTTYRGNAILGEAGPEAIVPLSGALGNVDKSVRRLSEIARGRFLGRPVSDSPARAGAYVSPGAIQVTSHVADPRQIGSAVLDRLTIAVGG